jgi:hypothetical protein
MSAASNKARWKAEATAVIELLARRAAAQPTLNRMRRHPHISELRSDTMSEWMTNGGFDPKTRRSRQGVWPHSHPEVRFTTMTTARITPKRHHRAVRAWSWVFDDRSRPIGIVEEARRWARLVRATNAADRRRARNRRHPRGRDPAGETGNRRWRTSMTIS